MTRRSQIGNLNTFPIRFCQPPLPLPQGQIYKLSLKFPTDYPFKAPTVKFETFCFHPNVDQYGNICLDILKDKWSAAYSVKTVLLSIQSLLGGESSSIVTM